MLELPEVVVDGGTEESLQYGAATVAMSVRPHWQRQQLNYKVRSSVLNSAHFLYC